MNILFISNSCDADTYARIRSLDINNQISPVQNFFKMIIDGLAENKFNNITCISIPQISKKSSGISVWHGRSVKTTDNLEYIYPTFRCNRFFKPFSQAHSVNRICKDWLNKHRPVDSIVIVDPILFHITKETLSLCHKKGYKIICILTDIPDIWTEMNKSGMNGIKKAIIKQWNICSAKGLVDYDGYVFLTEQMNEKVNKSNKPYIVMEGCVDVANRAKENDLRKKDIPRVVMYAGGVYDVFAIDRFAEAFIKADVEGYEFHVYGKGNCVNKITEIGKEHTNVKYCGILPREEIVDKEIAATLLANPRPPEDQYTKYSFPSKTMEYMSTGTPVLSTRLPGIPGEYEDFLFWLDDTDIDSMIDTVKKVLSLKPELLHEFGLKGKEFVINRKNNIYQAERIADLCKHILIVNLIQLLLLVVIIDKTTRCLG
jgi:glycosyltransferase involved in cell wall biosynthesis